jgi:peptide/nickel transport system permease protein
VLLLVHITPGDPLVAVLPADASQELARSCASPTASTVRCRCSSGSGCGARSWRSRQFHRHRPSGAVRSDARGRQHRDAGDRRGDDRLHAGLFFGLIAGYFRDTWIDKVATSIAIAGVSVPHYWLGMVLVIIFSVQLNWLPAVGAGPGGSGAWAWDWEHMRYLILPAITMSVIPMGIVTRTVRALTGDILSQDFVEALRAKGLRETRRVPPRHQERRADRAGGDGPATRLHARRLDPDRDRVLLAGLRASCSTRRSSSATCRCCRARSWCWRCSSCSSI